MDIVEQARNLITNEPVYDTLTVKGLISEIERLREALRPFTALFLYPDDLGFEASLDTKEDPDWDDDANDMQTENCFVLRRDIRSARAALKKDK